MTTARTDALIAEAARAGVTLGVIFQDRLKPDVQRLKALVDSGRLGSPILATAAVKWYRAPSYYRDSRWRGTRSLDGGGALMNQGVHTVDLLLWLFGPVRRVYAKTAAKLHQIEVEDTAVAVLEFENGALGTLEAATSAFPGYSRRIELTGSNGTVILDGDRLAAIDLQDATAAEKATPADASACDRERGVADRRGRVGAPARVRGLSPRRATPHRTVLRWPGRTRERRADRSHLPVFAYRSSGGTAILASLVRRMK